MIDLKNIQPLKKSKILLIGDSCLDEYVYGTVDRLSPESPVPVLKQTRRETKPGMAANVKENLEKLGCEVDFITNPESVIKTRYVDEKSGYHLLRVDQENIIIPWTGLIPYDVEIYDAIVISDYGKGFLDYRQINHIRNIFTGPIFLDTKKTDLSTFQGIFVKINELEYSRSTSLNNDLIVTLGNRGAMFKSNNNEVYYPAPKVEVFDVCGAGDTFLAALSYEYVANQNIDSAIKFAVKAGAITVMHNGNYAPSLEEIQ
jgi:D-beta-D-heptose 7-phosphate kinase/D-beta-D-heptose 1-phosphate adenosyltransferase